MKTQINKIKTFFTKSRKMNYATLLIVVAAYSGAMFYFGTQYTAHAQGSSVVVIKQAAPSK